MKRFYLIILFLGMSNSMVSYSQDSLRAILNESFTTSEVLEYRVHYGLMNAGEARLEIKKDLVKFGKRECYHVVGTGRSVGAFDWFFKVRDKYESFIDTEAMIPWYHTRKIEEGSYKREQDVTFYQMHKLAKDAKRVYNVPENVQDIVSAFYYARTWDLNNMEVGDTFPLNAFYSKSVIPIDVTFRGQETIKTKFGYIDCLKFSPMLQEGRVFKNPDDMVVWVSNDKNRIPVRIEAAILVGSVKADLKHYEGLKNPLAIVK
ncbi:MAG: DUF3108 domain-containing protein [Bacteroidia bacterium]|nr:DUF3108 domain-containing protein [Bacteroidia bacterium]